VLTNTPLKTSTSLRYATPVGKEYNTVSMTADERNQSRTFMHTLTTTG